MTAGERPMESPKSPGPGLRGCGEDLSPAAGAPDQPLLGRGLAIWRTQLWVVAAQKLALFCIARALVAIECFTLPRRESQHVCGTLGREDIRAAALRLRMLARLLGRSNFSDCMLRPSRTRETVAIPHGSVKRLLRRCHQACFPPSPPPARPTDGYEEFSHPPLLALLSRTATRPLGTALWSPTVREGPGAETSA